MEDHDSESGQPAGFLAEWMTRQELAEFLDVTPDTLKRWDGRRIGPACVRVGRKALYRRGAVKEWLLEQERRKPSQKGRTAR